MTKKILSVAVALLMSLPAWAETPAEAYRKHPDAICAFFITPPIKGDLKNFDIERAAFYSDKPPRVSFKIKGRNKEIVKYVSGTMEDESYSIGFTFTDGSALAVDANNVVMMYMSTKGQASVQLVDREKIIEYELLLESQGK